MTTAQEEFLHDVGDRVAFPIRSGGQRCQVCGVPFEPDDMAVRVPGVGVSHVGHTILASKYPAHPLPRQQPATEPRKVVTVNDLQWRNTTRDGAIGQAMLGALIRRNPDVGSKQRGNNTWQWAMVPQ